MPRHRAAFSTYCRSEGALGLGCAYHRSGDDDELLVYPDVPAARRLALAVRYGRFREQGLMSRGPLGLAACVDLVDRGLEMPLDDALSLEATTFGLLIATSDTAEAISVSFSTS